MILQLAYMAIQAEEFTLSALDGYPLAATHLAPVGELRGVVQFNSGTGIPRQLYRPFLEFLAESGYASLSFDYRGIAGSRPVSLRGFAASVMDWAQLDMPAAQAWLEAKYPEHRVQLVAHSMGGQLLGMIPTHARYSQAIAIASGTGYWRYMSAPFRYFTAAIWFTFIPITTAFFGYATAKAVGQGEDLPKNVALDWRRWCLRPEYFGPELGTRIRPVFFGEVTLPFISYRLSDDPIANDRTVPHLLSFYPNAAVTQHRITPEELGEKRIGHAGFFSRRFKASLWPRVVADLTAGNLAATPAL